MQQKIIWIFYLVLGSTILSCNHSINEYVVLGEFHYKNTTQKQVELKIYGGFQKSYITYIIMPNDSLILKTNSSSSQISSEPKNYKPAISADSTIIVFDDTLCYKEYNHKGIILQNIDTYNYKKLGEREYIFYFKIDSVLLGLSNKCY